MHQNGLIVIPVVWERINGATYSQYQMNDNSTRLFNPPIQNNCWNSHNFKQFSKSLEFFYISNQNDVK